MNSGNMESVTFRSDSTQYIAWCLISSSYLRICMSKWGEPQWRRPDPPQGSCLDLADRPGKTLYHMTMTQSEVITMIGTMTMAATVNSCLKDKHMSALRDGPHVHRIKSLNFPRNLVKHYHMLKIYRFSKILLFTWSYSSDSAEPT